MPKPHQQPKLHLDADTSSKALQQTLVARGYDVTRTPNEWMPLDADDETQLLGASAQGRVMFTYNIRDFTALAQRYPTHAGIVLAALNNASTERTCPFFRPITLLGFGYEVSSNLSLEYSSPAAGVADSKQGQRGRHWQDSAPSPPRCRPTAPCGGALLPRALRVGCALTAASPLLRAALAAGSRRAASGSVAEKSRLKCLSIYGNEYLDYPVSGVEHFAHRARV